MKTTPFEMVLIIRDIMKKTFRLLCALICISIMTNSIVFADSVYENVNSMLYADTLYTDTEKLSLPAVSKQQALEIAVEYIGKQFPDALESISADTATITHTKSAPYGYSIVFPRIINNIVYRQDSITVFIDSKNGQINSCAKNFTENISVEESSEIIDVKTAENIYRLAMGIHLQYNKKITDNKIKPYLTYTADDIVINAVTQNTVITPYIIPDNSNFDVVNTAEKVSEFVDDKDIISLAEATKIIQSIPELGVTDGYSISSVDYLKNYDDTHLISILYKNVNYLKQVTLNAKTGKLVEYSDNSADIGNDTADSEDTAEKFAEKYYGEFSSELLKRKKNDGSSTVLLYERTVNGIPYKSNGLYVSCIGGKIKQVSFAWDNTEFPAVDDIISEDYAYTQFFDKCGLELTYHRRENGVLTPVYRKSSQGTGIFDAQSGRQLNYDGSYYFNPKEMNYIDIESHYAGLYASKLSDCDIYVSSGNVYLEDYILQQEYLLLISEFIEGTKPVLSTTGILTDDQIEMLYSYMYSNGIMERSEAAPDSYVTRADAVKYLLRILGHGTIGDMSEIFITHFADSDEIPKNLIGYVELARSLGIVKGSLDNRFKPNEFLSNGDSLIIIYNYLTKQG